MALMCWPTFRHQLPSLALHARNPRMLIMRQPSILPDYWLRQVSVLSPAVGQALWKRVIKVPRMVRIFPLGAISNYHLNKTRIHFWTSLSTLNTFLYVKRSSSSILVPSSSFQGGLAPWMNCLKHSHLFKPKRSVTSLLSSMIPLIGVVCSIG